MKTQLLALLPLFAIALSSALPACSQPQNNQPGNSAQPVPHKGLAVATFGGGCFWCTQGVFDQAKGIKEAISGYAGGHVKNPSYEQVSTGTTGHAESVQLWYNPAEISYQQLLDIFFSTHDPTTLNRQGPDVGSQYRSVIFYRNPQERSLAEATINRLNKSAKYNQKIVTQVVPFEAFYPAEDYHQNYYKLHPDEPYIRAVSRPHIDKFRKEYKALLKSEK